MIVRVIGAILIIFGCGYVGFSLTADLKREEVTLHHLIGSLDYMQCELQYRMTPLPDLCRQIGLENHNQIGKVFLKLSEELENQLSPDVSSCVHTALACVPQLPNRAGKAFEIMGMSLGRFDVKGQVEELEAVRAYCRSELDAMARNRDARLHSYQTLGICTGAALAILFV